MAAGSSTGIDAIYQFTSAGVQVFSGAAFYLVIVRLFTTSTVGAIALFLAVLGLFGIIFSFGLATTIQHFTSYHLGNGDYRALRITLRRLLLYAAALAIAGALTTVLASGPISMVFLHTEAYSGLVRLLGLVLVGNIIYGILNGALLGLHRFRLAAMISVVTWVLYYFGAIGLTLVVRSVSEVVYGWVLGTYLGTALGVTALVMIVRGMKPTGAGGAPGQDDVKGKGPGTDTLIIYTLPVFLSGIIGYGATYVDRFVVAGLMTLSSLGIYNFALLVVGGIGFIASPFTNILLPKFSALFGAGLRGPIRDQVRMSTLLLSAIYVPIALAIAALAPTILELLGGRSYLGGSVPLSVIMFLSAAAVSGNILLQAIASIRRTQVFVYSSAAALASNVLLSILLIPRLGLLGASIGFSSANVASFLVLLVFSSRERLVSFDASGMEKVWASSVATFLLLMALELWVGSGVFMLLPYIVLGGALYLLLLKALGTFRGESKESIISLFPPSYGWLRRIISLLL